MAEARPVERTPFFEFQARNRRATWRLTAAYALVVGGVRVRVRDRLLRGNMFLVLFALVFLPAVLCLGIGALLLLSPGTAVLAERHLGRGPRPARRRGNLPRPCRATASAIWVIGLLLPLVCWLRSARSGARPESGHTLLAIGARSPAAGDLEERQLVNVVQEMAIAAGIPAPRCASSTPRWRMPPPSGWT